MEIKYDLKNIVFTVNGKSSAPIPMTKPGIWQAPLLFGGWGNGKGNGYFEGYLKELKITHNG